MMKTWSKQISLSAALWLPFILMFVLNFLFFYGRGAFGAEEFYKRVLILGLSNISIVCFIFFNIRFMKKMDLVFWFVILWALWVSVTCLIFLFHGPILFVKSLMEVLYCPLLFIGFYIYTKARPGFHDLSVNLFILMLLLSSILFVLVFQFRTGLIGGTKYHQINDVYYSLLLLPWVLLCGKPIFKYSSILVVAIIVIWSFKRTAMAAFFASITIYFVTDFFRGRKGFFFSRLFAFMVIASSIFFVFSEVDKRSDGFLSRRIDMINNSKGSGRLDIYKAVIQAQMESDLISWFIGHGHYGVSHQRAAPMRDFEKGRVVLRYQTAHNDWLEVLFDYGLVGLALYLCFHVLILQRTLRLLSIRSRFGPPMAVSYVLFFIMSLTSHLVLYASYFSYLMAFWGSIFAMSKHSVAEKRLDFNAKMAQ